MCPPIVCVYSSTNCVENFSSGIGTTRSSSDVGRHCYRSRTGVADGIDRQLYLWLIVSITLPAIK